MPETGLRFLADENFPLIAVQALRLEGFDVTWIRESSPGITDVEVLASAVRDNRLILTLDKDFGELAFHSGFSASIGVMLFRLPPFKPGSLARFVVEAVKSVENPIGYFTVVEPSRIRLRPLKK